MHPLNRLLSPLGVRVQRIEPKKPSLKPDYITILEHFGVNLILDVGAHEGTSALRLFESGYAGRIVSFEPVKAHFQVLSAKCERGRKAGYCWETRPFAIGNVDDAGTINLSHNGLSSSIADMLPAHVALNADSKYVGTENIIIRKLDTLLPDIICTGERVLLLLDVQGFEPNALAGAKKSLPRLAGVQMEVGFRPTYATGFDIPSAFNVMTQQGFTPCYVEPAWKDPLSCIFYQVDVLWFRLPENPTALSPRCIE